MIIRNFRVRKGIACFFLTLLTVQGLLPTTVWALTSGPAQPETKQFAQAGTTDMVDLSTGDFKYDIPLLDVDGYPVNLNYRSGMGMDDEASWVGLGWNLNMGAVNRQLRGIADDSNGDSVYTSNYMKPKITIGGRVTVNGEIFGNAVNGSVSMGIFSDNYTGIGAETGLNAGISLSRANSDGLTPGLNVGLSSSTSDGVSLTPSISLSMKDDIESQTHPGSSVSLGYNSREGLKELSLHQSFSHVDVNEISASLNYNTSPFYPKSNISFKSSNFTFSLSAGGAAEGIFAGGGVTGYKSKREVANQQQVNRTFGFLYAEKGKNVPAALTDFTREKDNPVIPELHNLALPVATPDVFSYTSQAGSGVLRLYRHSSGVVFDNSTTDVSDNTSASAEYGGGAYFHGGTTVFQQNVTTSNRKWTNDNSFLANGDYQEQSTPDEEEAYFKEGGEMNAEDPAFVNRILGEDAVSVPLNGKMATTGIRNTTTSSAVPLKKYGRQVRSTAVKILTAVQASKMALDEKIKIYPQNRFGSFSPVVCNTVAIQSEDRFNSFRKKDHISEITLTGQDGKRMVYGIPVYNKKQEEYSFATNNITLDRSKNLVTFQTKTLPDGSKEVVHTPLASGVSTTDEYYHVEKQPAYATSWLLTAVLSPDYVDMTGDGVSDDDRGTAIKFNYTRTAQNYGWRTPYAANSATYNRNLNADPDDDKASFVYGEKELWYVHSIESRTKIAYFITEDREDDLGCDWLGVKNTSTKQERLREIRLYNKSDLTTPVKTVKFTYDYTLCPGVPNSINGGGKLTLKSIYFTYRDSNKGSHHPYTFTYNPTQNPSYAYMAADRWGTPKPAGDNAADGFSQLNNDEFPYTTRDSARAASDAASWHLTKITLPTGGEINVDYESDDYAYVQNKQAMQMMKIGGLVDGNGNTVTSLRDAKGFRVQVPEPVTDVDVFKAKYLNGESYVYAKLWVNLSDNVTSTDQQWYDFVPCYGALDHVTVSGQDELLFFKNDTDGGVSVNPFISAAWQRMRLEYQRYAYPGFKNRITDDRPVAAAVSALANSIRNMSELWQNFNAKAFRKNFAAGVNLQKSFVRLVKRDGHKLGGGMRVHKIRMSDIWNDMDAHQSKATYGQIYDYSITENGNRVSSGVASYEPAVGGDENPMRLPVNYTQDVKWGLNNYFYLEEPFGESLFPSPQIVYRQVNVYDLDGTDDGNVDTHHMRGWSSYEFYTAKEFPVLIKQTPLEKSLHKPVSLSFVFGSKSVYELAMSQGYAITLNDMHGKPKAERTYNMSGAEIAATEYYYDATEEGGTQQLRNMVDVVDEKGNITKDQVMGRTIELFSDMRESEMNNTGKSINLGVDVIPVGPWVVPLPHFPWSQNDDYRLFRSASVLKTIQYNGIVTKVVKKINGSSISTENILFDKYTGAPVLNQTQNEFNDPVYSVNIPAYWMYNRMGLAYKNLGLMMNDFATDANGAPSPQYASYLVAGDELIDQRTGLKMWVINSPAGSNTTPQLRVITSTGKLTNDSFKGDVMVVRSGYRNVLSAPAAAITCLKNPIVGNTLEILSNQDVAAWKVLNASAVLYDEAWSQSADCNLKTCPPGTIESADGRCLIPAVKAPGWSFLPGVILTGSDGGYGSYGAPFRHQATPTQTYYESHAPYWQSNGGRLQAAGIQFQGQQLNVWYGVEKCINIETEDTYYFGYAGDDYIRFYVDGVLADDLESNDIGNYHYWRIMDYHLKAGKHIIRFEEKDAHGGAALGFEVYHSPLAALEAGDSVQIKAGRIFSTYDLRNNGDQDLLMFTADGSGNILTQNLTCQNAAALQLCDGIVNCGAVPKGSCPAGFKPSADGQACIPVNSNANSNTDLNIVKGDQDAIYSSDGAFFYNSIGSFQQQRTDAFWGSLNCTGGVIPNITTKSASYASRHVTVDTGSAAGAGLNAMALSATSYCGRLNNTGIWLQRRYTNNWVGINSCVQIPRTDVYYIGCGGDNQVRVYLDGNLVDSMRQNDVNDPTPFKRWKVIPVSISQGQHRVTIEGYDLGQKAAMGAEIYDNNLSGLLNDQANIIYSTINLLDGKKYDVYVKDASGAIVARTVSCLGGVIDPCGESGDCSIANAVVLNPYLTGYLGNWLPYKQMAWLSNRSGQGLPDAIAGGVDIRNNGYLETFIPFWTVNNGVWSNSSNTGWVAATTTTLYDKYAQEQESKNALNIYSAARYGFKSMLPVAVGTNARQREIFYDGFEDYKFNDLCDTTHACEPDAFNIHKITGTDYATWLNAADAHSGNYSLKLSSPLQLSTTVFSFEQQPGIYLTNNDKGEYYRKPDGWLGLRGFCPMPGKQYILNVWVKDGQGPQSPGISIAGITTQLKVKAMAEGWKLVEGVFTVPQGEMSTLSMTITGGSNVSIDDIRIYPYDGQIKSYAYDDKTMRVMAELDENNYATFYEYDDEGSLVRTKKETERGIMTIKETRSSYRKQN